MSEKINILLLGGTGAMGNGLVNIMANDNRFNVTITSRLHRTSKYDNIKYIKGNAKSKEFLEHLLQDKWDVVVDFMVYSTKEFKDRYLLFLQNTKQYIFISSARVYAESSVPITENSPRILDICTDQKYLSTDEYALSKARQEDMLNQSGYSNFTIIRPSLTYDEQRYQLAVFEKEDWLYRCLNGKKIVFPDSLKMVKQTLTYGGDVALAISKLIANPKALGVSVHIAGASPVTWGEALQIYTDCVEKYSERKLKVKHIPDATDLCKNLGSSWQLKYARGISRVFDNSRLEEIIGKVEFTDFKTGVQNCLQSFFSDKNLTLRIKEYNKSIAWRREAYLDRISSDFAVFGYFSSVKQKIGYVIKRFYK